MHKPVSTTGKCFLNVMAPAPLIGLRSVFTQLCPVAYEIYISKKAALYFGLVIRLLPVNKNVSFQRAGNSKEIGFFSFSQWCTHSKANVNMRLTSLRRETDPVRWTQTCASKYRHLGRAFTSARIIASMNKRGDSVYPLLDVTVGSLTRWRETFVFKPQETTTIYVAAKGSVKSLTNILKKHVFLLPHPLCGTCSTFPTFVLLAVSSQTQNGTPTLKSQTDCELCALLFSMCICSRTSPAFIHFLYVLRLRSGKQRSRKQGSVGNFPISFTSLNIPCLGQYHLQFN